MCYDVDMTWRDLGSGVVDVSVVAHKKLGKQFEKKEEKFTAIH